MFHRIKEVVPQDNCRISVSFCEGVIKVYDIMRAATKVMSLGVLLQDKELFNNVSVDVGGYGISWTDDLDLSCDELWENGTAVA